MIKRLGLIFIAVSFLAGCRSSLPSIPNPSSGDSSQSSANADTQIIQDMNIPREELVDYHSDKYGFSLRYPKKVLDSFNPQAGCLATIVAVEKTDGVIFAQKENFSTDSAHTGQCVMDKLGSDSARAKEMESVLESLADSSTYYGSYLEIYAQRIASEKDLPSFIAKWKNRGDCSIGESVAREDGSYQIHLSGGNAATGDTLSCTESTVLYNPKTTIALAYLFPVGRSDFFASAFFRPSHTERHAYDAAILNSITFK